MHLKYKGFNKLNLLLQLRIIKKDKELCDAFKITLVIHFHIFSKMKNIINMFWLIWHLILYYG